MNPFNRLIEVYVNVSLLADVFMTHIENFAKDPFENTYLYERIRI